MSEVFNSYGMEYDIPRKRVFSLDEIERGDHIAFHQMWGTYWHHAIVEYIDIFYDEIGVIHYSNTASDFIRDNFSLPLEKGKARVMQSTYKFSDQPIYLMQHEVSYDQEEVVYRALSQFRRNTNYNVFTNNCEHFAMWCKTGKSSSDQVETVKKVVGKQVRSTEVANSPALIGKLASHQGHRLGGAAFRVAGRQMGRQAGRAGLVVAGRQTGARIVAQSVGDEIGKQAAASATSGTAGALVGCAAVGGVIESVSMVYDIARASDKLQEGKITTKQYNNMVGKRVVTGATNVGGMVAGTAIGQAVIPIPFVGAAIGGIVGGLGGLLFGNVLVN